MNTKKILRLLQVAIILLIGLQSCRHQENEKKKVVYVNSYHRGFPPSDEITAGFTENIPADSFEVIAYFMDTKRNPSQEYIESRAEAIFDSIKEVMPDILVVSDDNAVKYLVEPYFQSSTLPIVFCGVNWSALQYDLSENYVTGILEVIPLAELLLVMKSYYPSMHKLLVLNENTTTSRKTKQLLDTLFNRVGVTATQELVDDFESWKSIFKEANQSYDIIYLQTNGAIRNWVHDEAVNFIYQHMEVPVVACEDFMMPYAMFGLTEVSKEQGIWAAETAKKILQGISPADIPIARNQMTTVWLNTILAEKIRFQPDSLLLNKARIVTD